MEIDVVGESQLVGYPSQFPSVSMINYETGEPNPRYWVLKLLKDHFGPGDRLIETSVADAGLSAQAFETRQGKELLIINKRNRAQTVTLPVVPGKASVSFVAPSTGDHPVAEAVLDSPTLALQPFEVAVVHWK